MERTRSGRTASSESETPDIVKEFQEIDLDSRKAAKSSTDPADRKRCPECYSVYISKRNKGIVHDPKEHDYRCGQCEERFDHPTTDVPPEKWPETDRKVQAGDASHFD